MQSTRQVFQRVLCSAKLFSAILCLIQCVVVAGWYDPKASISHIDAIDLGTNSTTAFNISTAGARQSSLSDQYITTRFEWSPRESLNETALSISTIWCTGGFALVNPRKILREGTCKREGYPSVVISFQGLETNKPPWALRRGFIVAGIAEGYRKMVQQQRFKGLKVKMYTTDGFVGYVEFRRQQDALPIHNIYGARAKFNDFEVSPEDGGRTNISISGSATTSTKPSSHWRQSTQNLTDEGSRSPSSIWDEVTLQCEYHDAHKVSLRALATLVVIYIEGAAATGDPLQNLLISTVDLGPDHRPKRPEDNVGIFAGFRTVRKRTSPPFFRASVLVTALVRHVIWITEHSRLSLFDCVVNEEFIPVGELWIQGDYQDLGGFTDSSQKEMHNLLALDTNTGSETAT